MQYASLLGFFTEPLYRQRRWPGAFFPLSLPTKQQANPVQNSMPEGEAGYWPFQYAAAWPYRKWIGTFWLSYSSNFRLALASNSRMMSEPPKPK